MKDKNITLNWLLMILISTLVSCQKNKKFQWQPGISAPKYYPISESTIDFGNAGNGSRMPFDNGWGNQYGFVVGERYKEIPEEVSVKYNSSAENYLYQGNIKLPQEKILELFRKYDTGNEAFNAYLIVGMAPGGNVRVWFNTPYSDIQNIEIAKAQLKGHYDETADEQYKTKNLENWGKYYTYWQNHGIPYDVWKENEKKYNLHFDFEKPNDKKVGFGYISADGTVYQAPAERCHQKLPVEFEMCWSSKSKESYCCKITMPKGFQKLVEQKKLKEVKISLEIEKDEEHGILYLTSNNEKIKILRFKNKKPTAEERKEIDYGYSPETEYFIP